MASVVVASKANQATTLPVVLIAQFAAESDPKANIQIKHEEIDRLKAGDDAAIEVTIGTEPSSYGSNDTIKALSVAYPFLKGKNSELVIFKITPNIRSDTDHFIGR